jgi:hypothetical protein
MRGGFAKRKKFKAEDADPSELREGSRHELEHTSDRRLARRIALDHLAEDPHYYSKLRQMERGGVSKMKIDETLARRIDRVLGKKRKGN